MWLMSLPRCVFNLCFGVTAENKTIACTVFPVMWPLCWAIPPVLRLPISGTRSHILIRMSPWQETTLCMWPLQPGRRGGHIRGGRTTVLNIWQLCLGSCFCLCIWQIWNLLTMPSTAMCCCCCCWFCDSLMPEAACWHLWSWLAKHSHWYPPVCAAWWQCKTDITGWVRHSLSGSLQTVHHCAVPGKVGLDAD